MFDHEMRRDELKELVVTSFSIASLCNLNDLATPPKYHEKRSIAQGLEFPCSSKTFPTSPSSTQQDHLEGTQS